MARRRSVAPLPLWEQTTCWVLGVTGILYGIYRVHLTSIRVQSSLQYLDVGWKLLGGIQDVGDYEWVVYSTHLCWCLLPIICVHIIVSRLLSRGNQRSLVKKLVYVTIGAAATCYLLQWRFLTLLIVTTVVFYVASTLHSLPVVWGLALLLIYACNSYARSVTDLLGVSASEDYFTAIYVWASVCLRCTCFAIERVWSLHANTTADSSPSSLSSTSSSSSSSSAAEVSSAECTQHANAESRLFSSTEIYSRNKGKCALNCDEQKSYVSVSSPGKPNGCGGDTARKYVYDWPVLSKVPGFLDALVYVFYVPLLFNGPPITFKSFKEQIENPSCLCENGYSHVVWKFCRVCFWFCFNNVMFHYVFFAAFGEDTATIQDADKWTLATTAYLIGQFMTNKYVVIYGAMTQTARLDGLALADNPVCISYIYAYSDMWKSFDRGLYSCLKRYIYIPLGGSQSGVLRSEVALLGTFWFMGYWHGGQYRYMMWALLNYVEVGLENIGAALQRSLLVQKHLISRMSAAAMRRLQAALFYPLFLLATTSNMFFLAGAPFAHLYLFRVCLELDSFLTFGLVVYCMTQNAKHLERLGLAKL